MGLLSSEPIGDASPPSRRWGPFYAPPEGPSHALNSPALKPTGPPAMKISSDGDALDQALAGMDAISFELRALRSAFGEANRRLTQCMDVIIALVSFDYDKKAEVYDRSDIFDGMAAGLNMLGEELSATTVSKAYVDNIIESMSDLLVVTDRDARIKTVNQSACDLVGYTKEELLTQPVTLLFPDLSVSELLASGGVRDQERDCQIRGGGVVRVSFSASVFRDKRGEAQGLVCVGRDLTEGKRIEEERWRLREAIQRQSIILEELSTPLIPITDEILVMPLIGTVDERRAMQLVETLLQGIVSRRTEVAIIDITGIRTMDNPGLAGILKAVQAVRLVGAQVVITGVRPEVARLLVAQGHDLSHIKTFGSLQHGIVHAMKRGRAATRPR
jgi:rsbT co-antagonist protein RsbR